MKIAAQIIGIFAMLFNILSYQQKNKAQIVALQLFGSTLFSIHFFMLGAYMGGLLNVIGIFRAIVFLKEDFFHAKHWAWLFGFIAIYLLSYLLTFTVFEKAFTLSNGIIELLPVIGMTATTFAFRAKSAKSTRLLGFVSSPAWLIYNVISVSIGAICCELFSLLSILIGLLRFDVKNKEGLKK